MGGDWVVCYVLPTRKIRDVVRLNFHVFSVVREILMSSQEQIPLNVTQVGIWRGTACDLLGNGAGASNEQVRFVSICVCWFTLVCWA